MPPDLPALYGLILEQTSQIRVLRRSHLAFWEHYSQLCKQLTDLFVCLERKGLVSEEDLRRPLELMDLQPGGVRLCHFCMALVFPHQIGCSACASSRFGRGYGKTGCAVRQPHGGALLAWLQVPKVVCAVGEAAGAFETRQLLATARVCVRALWPVLAQKGVVSCGEGNQAGAEPPPVWRRAKGRAAGKPWSLNEEGRLRLLQDARRASPLAEALTCAMDGWSVCQLRTTSREVNLSIVRSLALLQRPPHPKPEQLELRESSPASTNCVESAGRVTLSLLHDLRQSHTLADCLHSAMCVSSVRQFSAVSRSCRDCMCERKCLGLDGNRTGMFSIKLGGALCRNLARKRPLPPENPFQASLHSGSSSSSGGGSSRSSSSSSRATLQLSAAEACSPSAPAPAFSVVDSVEPVAEFLQMTEAIKKEWDRAQSSELQNLPGKGYPEASKPQRATGGTGKSSGTRRDLPFVFDNVLLVKLEGLKQRPELNGMTGKLVDAVAGGERWLVTLENRMRLRVCTFNLKLLLPDGVVKLSEACNNADFKLALLQAMRQSSVGSLRHQVPAQVEEMTGKREPPRLCLVGGCSGSKDAVRGCDLFDVRPEGLELSSVAPSMYTPRFYHCTEVVEGSVYALGGSDGTRVLNSVERLNPAVGSWEHLPPMSRVRVHACSAVVDGYIYVAGGYMGNTNSEQGQLVLSSMERYSPSMNTWQLLTSMQQARAFAVAAPTPNKQLMVCGGYDAELLFTAECFAPRAEGLGFGEWRSLPRMHYGGVSVAKAQDDFGYLYICGGSGSRHAQRFHPVLEVWERLPPMLVERCGAVAGAIGDGRIMVCGGLGRASPEFDLGSVDRCSAECFDPAVDTWSFLSPMKSARSFCASTVAHGRLYVFGGTRCDEGRPIKRLVGASRSPVQSGECFCFATLDWEDVPDMSVPRTGACLCAV